MKTNDRILLACVLTVGCILSGCTHTHKWVKPRKLGGYEGTSRIPISVELRLTDEYRGAKWDESYMGNKQVVPFGAHLVTNTVDCAQSTFAKVILTTSTTESPIAPNASAILIPRLVYIDISAANNFWNGYFTTALEWSLYDSRKKLVWVDSYRSELNGPPKGAGGIRKKVQREFDILLEDLLKHSQQGMLSSPEIRQFAGSLSRSANRE
jgi:hypothetical protein